MKASSQRELWRPVQGFSGYEVSNLGRVRSIDRFVKTWRGLRRARGRILKPREDKDGYWRVNFSVQHVHSVHLVHRLVAEAFLPRKPTKRHQLAHNDGKHKNNRASNLRWATSLENARDRRRHGTQICGEASPRAKLNDAVVQTLRREFLQGGQTFAGLGRKHGIFEITVKRAIRGITWAHVKDPAPVT